MGEQTPLTDRTDLLGQPAVVRRKPLVLETKDEDLAPSDPNIPVAIAWDNCDTDAMAKFESATHNDQIAAIVNVLNVLNVQPGESMRLSEPSSWTPVRDIPLLSPCLSFSCHVPSPTV